MSSTRNITTLFLAFFMSFAMGCGQDVYMEDLTETHVIVDSFVQADRIDNLDVLVVLDTSCSMSDNFTAVGEGLATLADDIGDVAVDFEIMFITNDVKDPDYIGPFGANSSDIDFLLAPGLLDHNGSTAEGGYAAHYLFESDPDEIYPSFTRDDADLLVFHISDEEEQSSISSELYAAWLRDLKGEQQVDVVSIVSTDTPCGQIGEKYIDLAVSYFAKSPLDLCEDEWSQWLVDSSFLTAKVDTFQLSQTPIISSLVVYVDFEVISYEVDWDYDEETNTVHFVNTPEYGQVVAIGYDVLDF
jgi:hypothetical protein